MTKFLLAAVLVFTFSSLADAQVRYATPRYATPRYGTPVYNRPVYNAGPQFYYDQLGNSATVIRTGPTQTQIYTSPPLPPPSYYYGSYYYPRNTLPSFGPYGYGYYPQWIP